MSLRDAALRLLESAETRARLDVGWSPDTVAVTRDSVLGLRRAVDESADRLPLSGPWRPVSLDPPEDADYLVQFADGKRCMGIFEAGEGRGWFCPDRDDPGERPAWWLLPSALPDPPAA